MLGVQLQLVGLVHVTLFPCVFQVEPFASLATLPGVSVPRLLLNRELVGPFKHRQKRPTDVARTGELVESVEELVRSAGWEGDLRKLQGLDAEIEGSDESAVPVAVPEVEGVFRTPVLPAKGGMPAREGKGGIKELEVAFSGLTVKDSMEGVETGSDQVGRKVCGGEKVLEVICEDSVSGDEREEKLQWRLNTQKEKEK